LEMEIRGQVFRTWSARKYIRYRTCRSRSVSKTCRLFRVHRVPRVHREARVRRGARGRCRAGQRHSGRSCVHGEVLEEDLDEEIHRDCTAEERRWDSCCDCELRLEVKQICCWLFLWTDGRDPLPDAVSPVRLRRS